MSELETATPPSTKKLLIGGGVALALAAVVLGVVLPAEYGIDPFGLGKTTGLSGMAGSGEMTELERGALREGVLTLSDQDMHEDRWEHQLAPYESIEFKYTLAEGQPMVFSWRATAPLKFDMHAHPFEGGVDLTESYGQAEAGKVNGLYIAPFTGIHGWYWQNRTMDNVTLVLNTAGAYSSSTVFEGSLERERPIAPVK